MLAPTRLGDSLGHQGCQLGLWNSVTVRGLTAAPGWEMEQRLLREPGRVEAARDVSPSPGHSEERQLLCPHPLVPTREGMDAG